MILSSVAYVSSNKTGIIIGCVEGMLRAHNIVSVSGGWSPDVADTDQWIEFEIEQWKSKLILT